MRDTISLENAEFVGECSMRKCYCHPSDPSKCINASKSI
ncbi:MAG: hypothetical protein FJY09_09405 [Chlorobi bacterium]|nr:hypothetical protein [Chlorobiota bacterium]